MDTTEKELESAFKYYREKGFPYPHFPPQTLWYQFGLLSNYKPIVARSVVLDMFGETAKIDIKSEYSGIHVANYFHPHIWSSHANGMKSATTAFESDKLLRRAIKLAKIWDKEINDTTLLLRLRTVSGTQICSNFRPMAAKAVYELYLDGNMIFDPCTGYGGRLLGFLSLGDSKKYYGVDPCLETHQGNLKMAEFFERSNDVTLFQQPMEEFDTNGYEGKFDLAFTSPPYFKKEIYSEEDTQSCNRYPQYENWLNLFCIRQWKKFTPYSDRVAFLPSTSLM